jgi:hypothetical protein
MPDNVKKNVLFLFGAGASVITGCPLTSQITEQVKNEINREPTLAANKE